jgi:hypothetical protein
MYGSKTPRKASKVNKGGTKGTKTKKTAAPKRKMY